MKYLIDTNVWLGRILDQARFGGVRSLLDAVPAEQVAITDFTFQTIVSLLLKMRRPESLKRFIQNAFVERQVGLVRLDPTDVERLLDVMRDHDLDYDDAYQYAAAEKYDLTIVSSDHDFDHTPGGRISPARTAGGP